MIRIGPGQPTAYVVAYLAKKQEVVDGKPTYAARVERAKKAWGSLSRTTQAFQSLKRTLTDECPGARRCVYCEDSLADEVEHVVPKDWRPDRVFRFDNYVYACGGCNGPKGNRYGVVVGDEVHEQERGAQVLPPVDGPSGLLDLRAEDPLAFFELDLAGTFSLLVRDDLTPRQQARAAFTEAVLHLNDREHLSKGRRAAYQAFRDGLKAYADERDGGASAPVLQERLENLLAYPHLTVLVEMWRQRVYYPDLKALFDRLPEAAGWPIFLGVVPLP